MKVAKGGEGRRSSFFLSFAGKKKSPGHIQLSITVIPTPNLRVSTMAKDSSRQQKRSRASDAAEKVSRPSDAGTKRRRTSETHEAQASATKPSSGAIKKVRKSDASLIGEEKSSASAPWSFSRPVGGRYSNLDPIVTEDEA
jgi:hypothetical protein